MQSDSIERDASSLPVVIPGGKTQAQMARELWGQRIQPDAMEDGITWGM